LEKDFPFFAHSAPDRPPAAWQRLEDHLLNVANLARSFAEEFGAGEWAYLAGLWHDLGKYSDDFQKMLLTRNGEDAHIENSPGRVDHSTAGAILADEIYRLQFHPLERVLAYVIAGHHAGLADWVASLDERLQKKDRLLKVINRIPLDIRDRTFPKEVPRYSSPPNPLALSLWIRMIFSCVLDADFLDTEKFLDSQRAVARKGYSELAALMPLFSSYIERI
jgi:CRISPR-associated endonuclease/helicase Cas3